MPTSHRYRNEILNKKFGLLQPIRYISSDPKSRRTIWECKCDCGNLKNVRSDCLRQGSVKSCGCLQNLCGSKNKRWEGYEGISASYWNKLRKDAHKRNFTFNISIEFGWKLFVKQEKTCALSGLPLVFWTKKSALDGTASLDRIDSKKGYEEDNVQWVYKDINFMKQDFDQRHFLNLCRKISEYGV